MCDYCSCRSMPAIEELGLAHARLGVLADEVRRGIAEGDAVRARAGLADLLDQLGEHTAFEEATVFAALQAEGEMGEDVAALLEDHRRSFEAVGDLPVDDGEWSSAVLQLVAELHDHIAREEYDLFPAMLMALSPSGWAAVERAAEAQRDR